MSLPIISAQQRMAERKGVKLLMLGKSGIGKTTRLKDLDPVTTLFLDIEAGDLAVADWPGDTLRPASWPESRDFFVFLAGPDRSLPPEAAFSQAHFDHVVEKFGDPAQLDRYQTFFLDSITQLSRQCFAWCKTQPGATSDRSGKPDLRAAYGLLGQEMISALTTSSMPAARTWCSWPSSMNGSTTTTARCSCRRSKAARPVWNCPASSTRW